MIIERTTLQSILPEAVDALVTNENAVIYNGAYGKRPPLGIYNVSLQKIWGSFEKVLNELDKVREMQTFRNAEQFAKEFDGNLIDCQENLLMAIKEHFDDCENTLRCFFSVAIGSSDEKLRSEKGPKDYFKAIKEVYFTPVSKIVNHVKHQQGRLRFVVVFNERYSIPGYFVEAISAKGRILPNREIHEPIKSKIDPNYGKDTAFSFSRDLRYLFWGIYFVSHHLAIAINAITNCTGPKKYSISGSIDAQVISIAERLSALPLYFYEDELIKDMPTISVSKTDTETKLKVSFPDPKPLLIGMSGQYSGLMHSIGDGVSTTYELIYVWGKLE